MTDVAETDAGTRRGRPRPQNAIERDEQVYQALHEFGGPATRNQLAEKLNMKSSHVYLSLIRLRQAGHVSRGDAEGNAASHTWQALDR